MSWFFRSTRPSAPIAMPRSDNGFPGEDHSSKPILATFSDEIKVFQLQKRVVGVVINAVDAHLLKGEQLDLRWTRDEIKVLPSLLYEARSARRVVVLLSDHGHLLENPSLETAA